MAFPRVFVDVAASGDLVVVMKPKNGPKMVGPALPLADLAAIYFTGTEGRKTDFREVKHYFVTQRPDRSSKLGVRMRKGHTIATDNPHLFKRIESRWRIELLVPVTSVG